MWRMYTILYSRWRIRRAGNREGAGRTRSRISLASSAVIPKTAAFDRPIPPGSRRRTVRRRFFRWRTRRESVVPRRRALKRERQSPRRESERDAARDGPAVVRRFVDRKRLAGFLGVDILGSVAIEAVKFERVGVAVHFERSATDDPNQMISPEDHRAKARV